MLQVYHVNWIDCELLHNFFLRRNSVMKSHSILKYCENHDECASYFTYLLFFFLFFGSLVSLPVNSLLFLLLFIFYFLFSCGNHAWKIYFQTWKKKRRLLSPLSFFSFRLILPVLFSSVTHIYMCHFEFLDNLLVLRNLNFTQVLFILQTLLPPNIILKIVNIKSNLSDDS